jgi:hypothetical protein
VWTMRSWVRSVVLVVLSAALVGAFAVPALGQPADPPPPSPDWYQATLDRLHDELADRLEQLRAAQRPSATPEEPEHSVSFYAWRVISAALDYGEWAADPGDKQEANAAEDEARQAEDEVNQANQPDTTEQPEPETLASGEQPAPADAQNRADLGLSGSDDHQEQQGTIMDQPGSVVGANGGLVGGQWKPDGTGDEQEDTTELEAIGGAVGAGTDNRGFNPFSDLFSEQFTVTPDPDLGPGILITPQPDLDLGQGILVTPQPHLGPDQEIFLPPEMELGRPGEEIWLPPELDPGQEILPPHGLPGVTDRSDLAPA